MKTPRYDSDVILKIAKSERFMSREQERGLFDSGLSFHSVVLFHSQAIYICRSFYKTSSVMMRRRAALDAIVVVLYTARAFFWKVLESIRPFYPQVRISGFMTLSF